MRPTLLFSAVLATASVSGAQSFQVTLPVPPPPVWTSNNFPVGGPSGLRYQQVFAPNQLASTVQHPVRFTGLDLIAGSPGGQSGTGLDLEVTLANGPAQPSTLMDNNLESGVVVVIPRSTHTLGPATPGTFPLQLVFNEEFVWDGQSSLVVDMKIFDNGTVSGQQFPYDLQATFSAGTQMFRMWGVGPDPRSVSSASFFQIGAGAAMRLTWQEGVTTSYGQGCPGAGNVVPVASTTGGNPVPGNTTWTHVLDKANSQVNAVLMFGVSRTTWAGSMLPLKLGFIGAGNCSLLTSIDVTASTTTVGGGPGAGSASIVAQVPPVSLFNQSAYTQWVVFDPMAPNGVLALSQGHWHVFP